MGVNRSKETIKFIVVHYTANYSKGAGALNHRTYLQNNRSRRGSAHYFVDNNYIVQTIPDTRAAYAVGDNQGHGNALNGATNYNSISVEICVNNGYTEEVLFNTMELVKELLRQYPNAKVCRHWDVTKKDCPAGYTGKSNARWDSFLREIKNNRRMLIPNNTNGGECTIIKGHNEIPKPVEEELPAGVISTAKAGYSVMVNTPKDVLNVREKPDASSKIVSSYRHTSKIYIHLVLHKKKDTWYKVEYKKGKFGYVAAKFCKGI